MTDSQQILSLPNGTGSPSASPQKAQPASGQSQPKRNNNRHKKNQSQTTVQPDGTVSDSVTNPMQSNQQKKATKRHQPSGVPRENGNNGKVNGKKTRPVSVGGNMLPATPAKEQAYAGPTFQASPAPSSLPLPKFFSRSVPNVAAQQKSLAPRMGGEKTPDAQESSPEPEVAAPSRDAQMSPLDMFFKADAAEREKSRSASLQSPEMQSRSVQPATEPRNPFQQTRKSILLREMDGDHDMPGPRTVSHAQRPLPPQRVHSTGAERSIQNSDSEREAMSKSLKDMLMKNVDVTPPKGAHRPTSGGRYDGSPFDSPSPFQRSASGPSTPTPNAEQNYHYYGNTNLSPFFQNIRNDTPPSRPSGLRQHELANDLSPTHNRHQQQALRPPIDPDSFSRSYLDQQIRASQPATLPNLPFTNNTNSSNPNGTTYGSGSSLSQQGVSANEAAPRQGNGSNPGSGSSAQDIRTMEDDLKRMLKINVLSN